jgi:hypothetical protein
MEPDASSLPSQVGNAIGQSSNGEVRVEITQIFTLA